MTSTQLAYDLPVVTQWPDGRILQCRAHRIEPHGITIKSPYTAKEGSQIKLGFKILINGTPQPISTVATVSLSYYSGSDNLFHIDLRFKQLSAEQLGHIEAFIRERKRG